MQHVRIVRHPHSLGDGSNAVASALRQGKRVACFAKVIGGGQCGLGWGLGLRLCQWG